MPMVENNAPANQFGRKSAPSAREPFWVFAFFEKKILQKQKKTVHHVFAIICVSGSGWASAVPFLSAIVMMFKWQEGSSGWAIN